MLEKILLIILLAIIFYQLFMVYNCKALPKKTLKKSKKSKKKSKKIDTIIIDEETYSDEKVVKNNASLKGYGRPHSTHEDEKGPSRSYNSRF